MSNGVFRQISDRNFYENLSTVSRETPDSDNDATCAELKADEGWKSSMSNNSRPISISSEPEKRWVDIVSGNCQETQEFP